ncbi:MAG: hypothetical protein RLN81_03410 [Balneolaceae bacterium]
MKSLFLKKSFLLIGCLCVLLAVCDEVDLEGEEAGEVQGFWELATGGGDFTYLSVAQDSVIFYYFDSSEDCITIDAFRVVQIDGTGFYILNRGGEGEENTVLAISRNRDRIDVRNINDTQREIDKFLLSTVDITTLAPVCVDETDVFGKWELTPEGEPPIYLSITPDSISVISKETVEDCYFISVLKVFEINGNVFTMDDNDPFSENGTQDVVIRRVPEGVEIERMEDGSLIKELYSVSNEDFSLFEPECEFTIPPAFMGLWQLETSNDINSPVLFLSLNNEELVYYNEIKSASETSCFDRFAYQIVSFVGDVLTLTTPEDPTFNLIYRLGVTEGKLVTTFENDISETFFRTDTPISELEGNQCTTQ